MTDAGAPGSHVLYQDFVIPVGPALAATLSFNLFIGNRSFDFFTPDPATLDFSLNLLNQQVRVDIMPASAPPFSVAVADILANVYQSKAGDPMIRGYDLTVADLTALLAAHQGETLRLRFAETDNLAPLQLGVDNVSLITRATTVSAPASLGLLALAMLWLTARRTVDGNRHTTYL